MGILPFKFMKIFAFLYLSEESLLKIKKWQLAKREGQTLKVSLQDNNLQKIKIFGYFPRLLPIRI